MDAFRDRAHDALKKAAAPTFARIREDLATPNLPDVVVRFLRHLLDHLFDPQLTVARARRALDVGNSALAIGFRDFLGVSAAKYVERRRIETADRMLGTSDVLVGRIGQEVGFASRSTFYEAYERVTGEKLKDARRRSTVPEIDYPTWRRWLRGDLAADEAQRVLDAFKSRYPDLDPPSSGGPSPRIVIDGAAYERFEAEKIWKTVRDRPFDEQRRIVRGYLFHSTALFDLLRKRSREEGRKDRRRGVGLARLALVSLEGHEEIFGDRIHDLRALGWAELANARRLALDFERAEKDFERADAEWSFPRAQLNPSVAATMQRLKGTLRMFQRRNDEALELFDESLRLSREVDDRDLSARALLQRGALFGYMDRETDSIADLDAAAAMTVDSGNPRLAYTARVNVANTQVRFGDFAAATKSIAKAKSAWRSIGHLFGQCEIRHLEGNLHEGLKEFSLAESCYREALRGFGDLGEERLWVLVALDQAILYSRLERTAESMKLAATILPVLNSTRLKPETLAAVRLLSEGVASMELGQELLRELRRKLQKDPLLRLY